MTFKKKFIEEMAKISGRAEQGQYSAEPQWKMVVKSKLKDTKKIAEVGDYVIYLHEDDMFYLTNATLDYLGFIEVRKTDKSDTFKIAYTNSNISGGFYKMMFDAIFGSGVKELWSDVSLSSNALKSYQNMVKKGSFNIQVITRDGEYMKFTKKALTAEDFNRISIKPL
jgi:hypothetical protein